MRPSTPARAASTQKCFKNGCFKNGTGYGVSGWPIQLLVLLAPFQRHGGDRRQPATPRAGPPLRPPRRRLRLPRLRLHPPHPRCLIAAHPVAAHVPDACGAAPGGRAVERAPDGRQQATTMTASPLGRGLARRCWQNSPLGREPVPEPCRGDRVGVAGGRHVDRAARPTAAARYGAGDSAKQQLVHAGPGECAVHSRGAAGVGGGGRRARRWGGGGQGHMSRGGQGPH